MSVLGSSRVEVDFFFVGLSPDEKVNVHYDFVAGTGNQKGLLTHHESPNNPHTVDPGGAIKITERTTLLTQHHEGVCDVSLTDLAGNPVKWVGTTLPAKIIGIRIP